MRKQPANGAGMAEAGDTWASLYQNLMDAGCSRKTAEECMEFAKAGQDAAMLKQLSRHRAALLESLHANQKQIDCLDFLVYQMGKKSGRKING